MEAVGELEPWVELVLKDANPNYKDPDTFFERMEAEQAKQPAKKETKTDISWLSMISAMKLVGMTKEFASHCVLESLDDNNCTLINHF